MYLCSWKVFFLHFESHAHATPKPRPRHAHATPTPRPRHAQATPTPRPRHARAMPAPRPRHAHATPKPRPTEQARASLCTPLFLKSKPHSKLFGEKWIFIKARQESFAARIMLATSCNHQAIMAISRLQRHFGFNQRLTERMDPTDPSVAVATGPMKGRVGGLRWGQLVHWFFPTAECYGVFAQYSPTAECYGVFAQYRFWCVLGELGRFREPVPGTSSGNLGSDRFCGSKAPFQKVAWKRFRRFRCLMGSEGLGSVPEVLTEPFLWEPGSRNPRY